jgi:hypothetical protein
MLNNCMTHQIDQITEWLATHKSSTLPGFLKRNNDLVNWVNTQTSWYDVKNIMERVYILLNGAPPKCLCNNYCKFNTFDLGYRPGCNLGNKCKSVAINRVNNQKQTLLDKYGVSSVSAIPNLSNKKRARYLEKHGVEHHTQTEQYKKTISANAQARGNDEKQRILEKTQKTSISKYGTTHHMKSDTQKTKVANTNIKKYGVEFPLQNITIKTKFVQTLQSRTIEQLASIEEKKRVTLLENYGVDAPSRINLPAATIDILNDKEKFVQCISSRTRSEVTRNLQIADHTLYLYAKKYQSANLFSRPLLSSFEIEIGDFLSLHNIEFVQNTRDIIAPLELDFYIPSKQLAIEVCGLYWHSEVSGRRNRQYHYNKFKMCEKLGIKLITIFEDEWKYKQSIVESRLQNLLGITNKRIYARQCLVEEITTDVAKDFINTHHLQGYSNSTINLALKDTLNNIVSVMTFAKPRFNNKYENEIIRFCSSGSVVGGASKLFDYFIKKYNPTSILSYSDNRWGNGSVYEHLGFKFKSLNIGYTYTDYKNRYTRNQYQKHKLVKLGYDSSLSEAEIMKSRGYDRIWDCGQTTWVYSNK